MRQTAVLAVITVWHSTHTQTIDDKLKQTCVLLFLLTLVSYCRFISPGAHHARNVLPEDRSEQSDTLAGKRKKTNINLGLSTHADRQLNPSISCCNCAEGRGERGDRGAGRRLCRAGDVQRDRQDC